MGDDSFVNIDVAHMKTEEADLTTTK